jgi:hypothetical protein
MLDPFFVPHLVPKTRRICSNALCAKPLSQLNKQDYCYSCYNRATLRRAEMPSHRPSAVRFVR